MSRVRNFAKWYGIYLASELAIAAVLFVVMGWPTQPLYWGLFLFVMPGVLAVGR